MWIYNCVLIYTVIVTAFTCICTISYKYNIDLHGWIHVQNELHIHVHTCTCI